VAFNTNCTRCSRLADFLENVRKDHPKYHARPVPPFGVSDPDLLIVGLAPGMHGANATGRPFTGDHAGIILYEMLYEFGFSNQPESTHRRDGLKLRQCRITNAVKCLPPQNKPVGQEINTCNEYLADEIRALKPDAIILALGGVAHKAVVRACGLRQKDYVFTHAGKHHLGGLQLLDSYHCSRYNTQTKRLTPAMFRGVFRKVRKLLDK